MSDGYTNQPTLSLLLTRIARGRLLRMADAAVEVMNCTRHLAERRRTVLSEAIGDRQIKTWEHYPETDVVDVRSGSRFYYHCHPMPHQPSAVHGHFHLFAQPRGLRTKVEPSALIHLGAVAVDARGSPIQLFTTNAWVTGGPWLDARSTLRLLDRFSIRSRRPSVLLSCWITGIVRLFHPQWRQLLLMRDQRLTWQPSQERALRDRRASVLSWAPVSIEAQVTALQHVLGRLHPTKAA